MNQYVAYPAILDDSENEKDMFTVTFPDLPGAISEGKGTAEAIEKGSEALGLYLYDEEKLPSPSKISQIIKANPDKLVVLIFADLSQTQQKTK
jgi:predicted RNase H-like HicB family nuclease